MGFAKESETTRGRELASIASKNSSSSSVSMTDSISPTGGDERVIDIGRFGTIVFVGESMAGGLLERDNEDLLSATVS